MVARLHKCFVYVNRNKTNKTLTLYGQRLGVQVSIALLCVSHCPPDPPLLSFYLYLSPQLQCFWGGPSRFPSCPEKSILGGGLKDLSQEYYSTAQHYDKPPVTSSRDGAGQARAPHLGEKAFSSGRGEERHKGQDVDHKSIGVGY